MHSLLVRCVRRLGLHCYLALIPMSTGVLTNVSLHPVRQSLVPEQDILTPALKDAGYKAGYVGKWHVNNELTPVDFGFNDYISLADYDRWRLNEGLGIPAAAKDYSPGLPADGLDPLPVEKCRDAWQCDRAMDLMTKYQGGGNPFFVRIDFHGPHAPMVIPEPYKSMYENAGIEEWPNFKDSLENKPRVQLAKRELYKTEHTTWEQWRPKVASYFGEVSLIDAQIGRVLDFLDEQGLAENTLVIFTTDHGDTFGAHRMRNKDYVMYEEVYRVPLVARWPGVIEAGRTSDAYTHHVVDLCVSLLDERDQRSPV